MGWGNGNGFWGRRDRKSARPGRPTRYRDLANGVSGWSQTLPGRREVVTPCVDAGDFAGRAITPPAVSNGRVYAGTCDGRARGWDAGSGELLFAYPVAVCLSWQPVAANGWLYCGAPDGRLVALHTRDARDDGWPVWGGGPGHCRAAAV